MRKISSLAPLSLLLLILPPIAAAYPLPRISLIISVLPGGDICGW